MTHTEIKRLGRRVLERAGYGNDAIGQVLPHWVDGFKRGVKAASPKQRARARRK